MKLNRRSGDYAKTKPSYEFLEQRRPKMKSNGSKYKDVGNQVDLLPIREEYIYVPAEDGIKAGAEQVDMKVKWDQAIADDLKNSELYH